MARTDRTQEILDEIERLSAAVAELRGEESRLRRSQSLTATADRLREEIAQLKIDRSRLTEEHAREKRETEHLVGLERRRVDFEKEAGVREATLKVREENLAADKARFTEQMEFHRKRFEAEVGYLKDMIGQVLERLPGTPTKRTPTKRTPTKEADDGLG